jgi:hypothetical protein
MGKKKTVTERRITAAYNKVAAGIPIDIMDIPRIWDAAEDAIKAGADDDGLEKAISDVMAIIRKA